MNNNILNEKYTFNILSKNRFVTEDLNCCQYDIALFQKNSANSKWRYS